MARPVRVRFTQSESEFARAWLIEYFRGKPRLGIHRGLTGPVMIVLGLVTSRGNPSGNAGALSSALLCFGLYFLLRPLLLMAFVLHRRKKTGQRGTEVRMTFDDEQISVIGHDSQHKLPWASISAAGERKDYIWFEVAGRSSVVVPFRALGAEERLGLIELFREKGKWPHTAHA